MTPDELVEGVRQDPGSLPRAFAAAGRALRGRPTDDVWSVAPEDALRRALLEALPDPWSVLDDLWRHGDSTERRAVLRALHGLARRDVAVVRHLVAEALRTNDIRLVAAALTPTGVDVLDEAELGQAVLKVAFLGLDVRRVPGLAERITPGIVHQLMGLVLERVAAGRDAPIGVWEVVASHPDDEAEEALREELWSTVPARREAACRALQGLEGALR